MKIKVTCSEEKPDPNVTEKEAAIGKLNDAAGQLAKASEALAAAEASDLAELLGEEATDVLIRVKAARQVLELEVPPKIAAT